MVFGDDSYLDFLLFGLKINVGLGALNVEHNLFNIVVAGLKNIDDSKTKEVLILEISVIIYNYIKSPDSDCLGKVEILDSDIAS